MKTNDAIYSILGYAETVTFDKLPPRVVEITKRFILDTFATMAAGTRAPGCCEVIEQLREWGAKPEATVADGGGKLPAPYAALANSMMSHALDYDDVHEEADVHANAVVMPAAIAAAETSENISGPELIAAITVGIDVACRMGMAIKRYRGWHPTATCGIFGATLAVGRVLGLRKSLLHHAIGIAYSLASGNFQCILDSSLTKRLQPAFAARGAVEAGVLARRGITGAKDVLEGTFGFYPLYEAGEYDRTALIDSLGERFEGENLSMKPWPSCRCCHAAIDAVLELCAEAEIVPEEVYSIRIEMPQEDHDLVGGPFKPGDSPQVSAQFNTAYNVAVALLYRRVDLEHFESQAIKDPKVIALAERVTTVPNDEPNSLGPVTVTITLKSKRTYVRRITTIKGHPAKTMTEAECMQKLRSCVAYAGWPERKVTELAEWVADLDRTKAPVTALSRLFS